MSKKPSIRPAHKYRPLELPGEIRLVALAPGSGKDPVDCRIIHTQLKDHPYQALSYEWGQHDDADPKIAANGCSVQVRMNLHDALKQIRDKKQATLLWIDALCINQADVQERNRQVKMMAQIYKTAEKVIVWLGKAKDGSDFAMDMFAHHDRLVRYIGDLKPEKQEAMVALCQRSYWHRAWVVQEMFLARDMSIHCGDRSVSADDFSRALATICGSSSKHDYCDKIMLSVANIHRITKYDVPPSSNTLHRWLTFSIMSGFRCAEPRDAVYALLGVAVDCQRGSGLVPVSVPVPDYEKPVRDVFVETLEFCTATATATSMTKSRFHKLKRGLAEKLNLALDEDLEHVIAKFAPS